MVKGEIMMGLGSWGSWELGLQYCCSHPCIPVGTGGRCMAHLAGGILWLVVDVGRWLAVLGRSRGGAAGGGT